MCTQPVETAAPHAEVRETHTGVVVLVGKRAYKAKRPVLTDFLDFRTVELRERACLREIELNRRLSPGSYLGLAHLSDPAGGPAEPVVVMRRYRDDDRLAFRVMHGRDEPGESMLDMLETIAGVLARFHQRAERNSAISAQGAPTAIGERWRENLGELHAYANKMEDPSWTACLKRIEHLVGEFVRGRELLFTRRVEEGCIVDGHADLLADDIFWADGKAALLDCLEFDDELRYVDRVDDAAFLAMDLEFLGRPDFGDYFLEAYTARSGDTAPRSLRDFYISYRAVVRAKVDFLCSSQGKSNAQADAARHLDIALAHLQKGAIRLALVGGNPGTGKSTVARALAEDVGATVISTDDVRRELRDHGAIAGTVGVLHDGLYAPGNVAKVYEEILRRARALLSGGRSVVLDATWRDPGLRASAHRVAVETQSALVELMCTVPNGLAVERIRIRQRGNSDATPEIAAGLGAREDDWDTAELVDTSRGVEHALQPARDAWRCAVGPPGTAGSAPCVKGDGQASGYVRNVDDGGHRHIDP